MSAGSVANWAVSKRLFHWSLALAVVVALIAPKPEDGGGLVHIGAGVTALSLVLARIGWRLSGGVRPFVKDAWRIRLPDPSKGPRGFAPPLMQLARLGGLLFLILIPLAVGLALGGLGQGEDSPLLEAHEAAGTTIMALAIGHALAVPLFSVLTKFDVIAVTLTGAARGVLEGGVRGATGLVLGAAIGLAAMAYVWGPFGVQTKVAALEQAERDGATGEREDD